MLWCFEVMVTFGEDWPVYTLALIGYGEVSDVARFCGALERGGGRQDAIR